MAQNGTNTMEKFKKFRIRRKKKIGQTWANIAYDQGVVIGLAQSLDWGGTNPSPTKMALNSWTKPPNINPPLYLGAKPKKNPEWLLFTDPGGSTQALLVPSCLCVL